MRALDKASKPLGETEVFKYVMDPIMINRVEGLGGVKKKKKSINFLLDTLKEKSVNIQDMIGACPTVKKPFLGGVDNIKDSRHDVASNGSCEDAIIRISNAERPSVGN